MCHHQFAAGLLQLSVAIIRPNYQVSVYQNLTSIGYRECAECCCPNRLPSLSRQHHSVDLLKDLYRLPVRGRGDYKIAVQSRVLRSSTSDLPSTQSLSTNIAARRFSCCAPTVWNSHLYAQLTVVLFLGIMQLMFSRHL